MKNLVKYQTYQSRGIKIVMTYLIILLAVMAIATAVNVSKAATAALTQGQLVLLLICFIICDVVLLFIGRMPLSAYFTEEGIVCKGFYKAKPPIPWDSLQEVGISLAGNKKRNSYLYFSANPQVKEYDGNIQQIASLKNSVAVKYDKETLAAAKKYYQGEIKDELGLYDPNDAHNIHDMHESHESHHAQETHESEETQVASETSEREL